MFRPQTHIPILFPGASASKRCQSALHEQQQLFSFATAEAWRRRPQACVDTCSQACSSCSNNSNLAPLGPSLRLVSGPASNHASISMDQNTTSNPDSYTDNLPAIPQIFLATILAPITFVLLLALFGSYFYLEHKGRRIVAQTQAQNPPNLESLLPDDE